MPDIVLKELRAQIVTLQSDNERLTKERDEWKDAAVNGGNAGYLRAQVAELTVKLQQNTAAWRNKLAAAQAREAELREALECYRGNRKPTYHNTDEPTFPADEALSLPHNTTALDERLAQERERCAESIEFFGAAMNNNYGRECADAIRSLK